MVIILRSTHTESDVNYTAIKRGVAAFILMAQTQQ